MDDVHKKYLGHPVDVYFNIHKQLWSVRSRKTQRILFHSTEVIIKDAKFIVRESGRKRVIKEQRKNVHAFVRGELVSSQLPHDTYEGVKVWYDPYKHSTFVLTDESPIYAASVVWLGRWSQTDCWAMEPKLSKRAKETKVAQNKNIC